MIRLALAIARASLDGSGVEQSFIGGANAPDGVAVDAGHIYWANYGCSGFHPKARLKTRAARARARFVFASDQPGASFRCALDSGKLKPCASPKSYRLRPGRHTFEVEASIAAGTDPTPARFSFKVVRQRRQGKRHGGGRPW